MGIFDFFKGKKENSNDSVSRVNQDDMEDVGISDEQKIIKKLYPNLKGIDFGDVFTTAKGDSPEKFFNSDIDGKWYFSVQNFAMIFKSFSDINYKKGVLNLLRENNLDKDSIVEETDHDYWQGDGFKIETPKMPEINLVIITNERVTHKDAVALQSLDKLRRVNIEWVSGIQNVYEGSDALKRFNLTKDLVNIALLFLEPDSEYIVIHNRASNVAKQIIMNIIKLNGGLDNFEEVNGQEGWESLYAGNRFIIGYLPRHQAVRLNRNNT